VTRWPVIVERLDAKTACACYCEKCGWTGRQEDPSDGPVSDVAVCPKCDAFALDYCYEEGVRCANCRKLEIDLPLSDRNGHYCSRPCLLQAEYSRSLTV
jgi:hypothetical protein